jgi:hypothetical protein
MTSCADKKSHACLIDVRVILRKKTIPLDDNIRQLLLDTKSAVRRLGEYATAFEDRLSSLAGDDSLDDFKIQDLMSEYNQAKTLACSILKKRDEAAAAIFAKVG